MENKKYVIGADIGGTTVKLGLFEEDGTLLEKWEIPTVIEGDGTAVLRDIAAEIQKCREKHNIPADGILGVGAGIPGPVTADGVVHRCVNLGWGVFDVRTALEETVVFITLGTGVGGAVISDGRMVAGANGAAGEFGHMTINPAETETCACGRRGCVQQYVSASGIARLARKYLAEHEGESALRSVEKLTTKDVFDAAKNGDSAANAILESVYDAFGYAISAVCTVADPEVVVIGGGNTYFTRAPTFGLTWPCSATTPAFTAAASCFWTALRDKNGKDREKWIIPKQSYLNRCRSRRRS